MKLLIKNGRVVDAANKIDDVLDILVEDSRIVRLGPGIEDKADQVIDATAKIVMPGIVDMHVHLREPGREDKETVSSATRAALKGGVTSVLAMPNTEPAIDSLEQLKLLEGIINKTARANVYISGAITKGRLGQELVDIAGLTKAGALAFTDDGASVENADLLLTALKQTKKNRVLLIEHCQDYRLSAGGVVNLGLVSTRLGLKGISAASEYSRVERDVRLAQQAEAALHIAHVSSKESVEIIARAKKQGVQITAEVTPHHLALSEEAVLEYDTNKKMSPPLGTTQDRQALRDALKNGVIDVIASDHAPHTANEKAVEFERAEFGVIGLETELAVVITELVHQKILNWTDLVRVLCFNPARILGINKGTLGVGSDADIIVVDPQQEWLVEKTALLSQSRNSAFLGRTLKGVVVFTVLAGKVVYQSGDKIRT